MQSGSIAKTASDTVTGSLSYISQLISGATSSGSYSVFVPYTYMNSAMATQLTSIYGYSVSKRFSDMGTNREYLISWGTIDDPTPTPTPSPTATPTPTTAPTSTPTPLPATSTPTPLPATSTPTPSPTAVPATSTPTPTTVQLYQSYDYLINATDFTNATGNTGANATYNNKVVITITNGYNCGNTTERNFVYTFSAAGSYISWLVSRKTDVPVIGYYKDDVYITAGIVSTQTINATVPC